MGKVPVLPFILFYKDCFFKNTQENWVSLYSEFILRTESMFTRNPAIELRSIFISIIIWSLHCLTVVFVYVREREGERAREPRGRGCRPGGVSSVEVEPTAFGRCVGPA